MDDPNVTEERNDAPETSTTTATRKPAKPKEKDSPGTSTKVLGDLAAAQKAVRDQMSVPIGSQYQVALACLVGNDNYRTEPSNLARLGYKLVDKDDPEHSLLDMCLSQDMDTVRAVVALFDEHESGPGEDQDDDASTATRSTSIVSLAKKFDQVQQLQPVCVRPVGKGENRILIFGQRRVAAAAYRHARSRVLVEDGVEGATIVPAVVKAIVAKVPPEQAWMMAVSENSDRKDDDPIQEGTVYSRIMSMVDPETGKRYSLTKTAKLLNVNKGRVRSYKALLDPRDEKKDKGLTDEDREAISTGKKTVTWGIRRALGEKHYSDGHPQSNRAKPIPLKAMQTLFDDTAETNIDRRKAIAACMGFQDTDEGLAEAVKQSETRIAEQESKKPRGKRKKDEPQDDNLTAGDENNGEEPVEDSGDE